MTIVIYGARSQLPRSEPWRAPLVTRRQPSLFARSALTLQDGRGFMGGLRGNGDHSQSLLAWGLPATLQGLALGGDPCRGHGRHGGAAGKAGQAPVGRTQERRDQCRPELCPQALSGFQLPRKHTDVFLEEHAAGVPALIDSHLPRAEEPCASGVLQLGLGSPFVDKWLRAVFCTLSREKNL